MIKVCEKCSAEFHVKKHRAQTARFCSFTCRGHKRPPGAKGKRPVNAFAAGHAPWNVGMRGLHVSPATEFKPGNRPHTWQPVGTISIRGDHGAPRAFVKVAEPNVWKMRAVLVWEEHHGALPAGHVVHHEDRDTLNDSLENLHALHRADHLREHAHELRVAQLASPRGRGADHWMRRAPERIARGEGARKSSLTERDVLEIRARADRGDGYRTIARDYPVTRDAIRAIARRKTWAHLPERAGGER
jgi:hypothetical protein